MTLDDTYYLNRSGRYINPLNSNDRLPVVYGDLTDGANGNWALPCIDTAAFVYCFADHEVLSVANGNSINIYKDGVFVAPADYTFDESDNYESEGIIAKITFAASQGNAVISARGKGKPTISGGATLMDDIIDIIYDFLTVENAWVAADFNATKKAIASQTFQNAGYAAAGVIHQDIVVWTLLAQMVGSFLGQVYLDGYGLICLEIDNGVVNESERATIIPKSHINLIAAAQTIENLINQCPAAYAYDYVADSKFKSHTDDAAHADATSQTIYGVRKPVEPYRFYWCRDLTSVNTVQDVIVSKYKDPLWDIVFDDITGRTIHADVGDLVIATIDRLYNKLGAQYTNHLWRVVAVAPDAQLGKTRLTGRDTGYYLYATYYADGSHLADGSIHAGCDRDLTEY